METKTRETEKDEWLTRAAIVRILSIQDVVGGAAPKPQTRRLLCWQIVGAEQKWNSEQEGRMWMDETCSSVLHDECHS